VNLRYYITLFKQAIDPICIHRDSWKVSCWAVGPYSNYRYPTFATFRYQCYGNLVLGGEVGRCGLVDEEAEESRTKP